MTLTDRQLDRYARHIVLRDIGGAGQAQLINSHVMLIGAGGIGCPAIQYLAAAGVGTLSVIDDDAVSLSNLQRQILYSENDVGTAKVDAASSAARRLNPDITFRAIRQRISAATTSVIFAGVDVVIDGCDNFATRLLVNDLCLRAKVPLVSARYRAVSWPDWHIYEVGRPTRLVTVALWATRMIPTNAMTARRKASLVRCAAVIGELRRYGSHPHSHRLWGSAKGQAAPVRRACARHAHHPLAQRPGLRKLRRARRVTPQPIAGRFALRARADFLQTTGCHAMAQG